ncbi:hypothetical protein VIN13_2876 [Saccharomyces cerevisiae Vin13]|nr:hypothetical protein VIN13_2876 [Saccharomyces cerevisiae Vin13]
MCSIKRVERPASGIPEIAIILLIDKRPLLNALKRVGLVYPENSNAQTLLLKSPSSSSGFQVLKNDQYAASSETSWEKAGSCSLTFALGFHGTMPSSPGHCHRYQPLRTTVPTSSRLLAPHRNCYGSVPALVLYSQPHLFPFFLVCGCRSFEERIFGLFFAALKMPRSGTFYVCFFLSFYYFLVLAK